MPGHPYIRVVALEGGGGSKGQVRSGERDQIIHILNATGGIGLGLHYPYRSTEGTPERVDIHRLRPVEGAGVIRT